MPPGGLEQSREQSRFHPRNISYSLDNLVSHRPYRLRGAILPRLCWLCARWLLRFARDRRAWVYWLYVARQRLALCVLNRQVTGRWIADVC
jgi:hypothetical protein